MESPQHLLVLYQNAVHFFAPYAPVQRKIGGGLVLLGRDEISRIIILVDLGCEFALAFVSVVEKLGRGWVITIIALVNIFLLDASSI